MNKFQNKYLIPSTRLQNWDYGWNAEYFITICTHDRECYFGKIVNGRMKLSDIGVLADVLWYEIKNHKKDVEICPFVVMPNHIHGILTLHGDGHVVETRHALSLQSEKTIGQKRFQNQGRNTVSSIIGSYKSTVSRHAHRLGYNFTWQSRFNDHIIRNEKSFKKISEYITNNPSKWDNDELKPI